jgi:hypothetical protein
MAALSGEDARGRRAGPAVRPGHRRRHPAAAGAVPGAALRAGGAPGPRRRAHAVAGAQPAAHPHRGRGPGGWLAHGGAEAQAPADRALQGQGRRPGAAAKSLSGGNLQKFIVGREIDAQPKLLIVSQPTWGVDVGAAAQIRGEMLALRDAGCAVLVVSEELDELFEICDRLVVIAKGHLSPSVAAARRQHRADRRVDERAVGRPAGRLATHG